MGTSVERASAMTELFRRGESFGIKGYEIDGMDPLLSLIHISEPTRPY